MVVMIRDPMIFDPILAARRATDVDRWDEVWDGVNVMSSPPNDEHADIAGQLHSFFLLVLQQAQLGQVRSNVAVSDREENWKNNYRVPDVSVFLKAGRARNCGAFWLGGPDFLVEIASPHDQTYDKFPFYSAIGTREVLIVERNPWRLELHRLTGKELQLVATSTVEQPTLLTSDVIAFTFRLLPGQTRPRIEAVDTAGGQKWVI